MLRLFFVNLYNCLFHHSYQADGSQVGPKVFFFWDTEKEQSLLSKTWNVFVGDNDNPGPRHCELFPKSLIHLERPQPSK